MASLSAASSRALFSSQSRVQCIYVKVVGSRATKLFKQPESSHTSRVSVSQVSDHLAASSVSDALMTKLEARQRDLETSTSCVFRSNSQGQGRHDRGRQSLRVDALDSGRGRSGGGASGRVAPPVAAEVQAVTGLRVTAQNQKLEQVADWGSSCRVSPGSVKLGAEQKSRTNFAVDDAVIVSRVQSREWEGSLTLHGDSCHVSPHPSPSQPPAPISSCGSVRQHASLKGSHWSTGEASRASGQGLGHGQRQDQGVPPNALPSLPRCRRESRPE